MTEPINDLSYWRGRLVDAKRGHLHHAIFRCPADRWRKIEDKHRQILAATIKPNDSVLDAGCGWGRLLSLMPPEWKGLYVGVDLLPDFIDMAKENYPDRSFMVANLVEWQVPTMPVVFDWAILISMRPMIRRNLGDDAWNRVELNLRTVCAKLLYLEYDPDDNGSIE